MVDYGPLYQAAGNQYGIDPLLLQTIAGKESDQDPNAVGPTITQGPAAGQHALGMMQFIPQTAAQYDVTYPMSPVQSVFGASNYMDTLLKKHGGNLRAALAEYSGNAGNQNAPYVNDVMGRYTALQRAWATPQTASAAPATDTDPDSPTVGQATGKNFTTPQQVPTFGTTARGNPGQPTPSVPTTAASDAPPAGISMAAPGLEPPTAGGPKGQRTSAQAPDYLENAPKTPSKPVAAPAPSAALAASASAPDYLEEAPQAVDASGQPIKPMDTGQYLTAATSPGARAVGTAPVEGFELGPGAQAKLGTATDPEQRVRIAASEAGVSPDSIIVGADNRLAAVGKNGVPYYLTPQRIFANQAGVTKDASGNWGSTGTFQFSPYAVQSPLAPNAPGSFASNNLMRGGAAALPAAVAQVPMVAGTAIGEAVGGPVAGSVGTGVGTGLGEAGRQWLANRFDPDNASAPSPVTGQTVRNALTAGGTYLLGRFGQEMLSPEPATMLRPTGNWLYNRPQPITRQQPYGLQDKLFPWEPRQRWELPPTQGGRYLLDSEPPAPSSPVPWVVPPTPGAEPAEVAGVPQVKTEAQIAAEDRAIPSSAPPLRFPLVSDQAFKDRAQDIVRWYAQNGNTTPEPGATGTLAQLTGNRGLAALERGLRNESGPVANEIGQMEDAQAAANRETVANLRGDEDQLSAMRQARTRQTAELEAKAIAGKTTTDPSDVQAVVDTQLGSRAAQDPNVASALRDVRERLYQHDPITGKIVEDESGNPVLQTDPEQLMGLRQSLAREMTRQAQSGRPDMRLASLQLAPVLDQLDTAITRGMPDYPAFNAAYREASKPITAMEYLQGRNLVDTTTQTPMLSAVQKTLDDIYRQRVLAHGWQPAQDLSQGQIDQLTALRDQLRRQANLRRGIAIGSPTVQNLATSQTTNLLMNPLMRAARPAIASALGVHEFGLPGFALGMGEAAIEGIAAQRQMAARQRLYSEIARLLMNRNGEGVAALQGQ